MKERLLLLKSKTNEAVHERIWWTYNYGADSDNQMSHMIAEKLSESLDGFIDELYKEYELLTEEQLHARMKCQVENLCSIYQTLLDESEGLYDYGGLNEFFIDIAECFPFYERKKYCNEKDMLFDCLNGMPFAER